MATMLLSRITAIWTRLDLPDPILSWEIVSGMRAAKAPRNSHLNCKWNHCGRDPFSRACRVAWRVAFRLTRELGEVPFITIDERRAA
jgi:hypothetical protein